MKKVLLSVAVVATFGMASCGGSDVCDCVSMVDDMAKEIKDAGDDADKMKEITEKYDEKAKECEKRMKDMSEEDAKKAMEDCK